MEEDQKSQHTCKFCHKMFPCGRSLGGHMRSHLIPISSTQKKQSQHQEKPISVDDKLCKECGKSFQSWKALFAHMKHHANVDEDGSLNSSGHDQKTDTESATLCRKKRSERTKRYMNSNLDEQEQEEVALSLIMLSMDCVSESHNTSSESSEAKRLARKRVKSSDDIECEVNSPKDGSSVNPFGSDHKKKRNSSKKKCTDSTNCEVMMNGCKFSCIICKKGFPSYQALGGHRASHKKFKGCCAPPTDDLQEKNQVECNKSREHECLICFRVFPSGQALGGHKRSHLMSDQGKSSSEKQIPEIREFLDLNLPAPDEEEDCNEFKTWWVGNKNHHKPLLGLLSS